MSSPFQSLTKFLPQDTFQLVEPHLLQNRVTLKITRPRQSKLGDYRPPRTKNEPHRISVNGNLNKYSFLITLVHEIAHLYTFKTYGRKVKPHGGEWKSYFKQLLQPHINQQVFPENVALALENYIANPAASSCTDHNLFLALESHNQGDTTETRVGDLEPGSRFIFQGRLFKVDRKLRTRFSCTEVANNKKFYFSALAPVNPVHD